MELSGVSGFAVFAVALILVLGCADADVSASTSKSWSRLEANQDALFLIDQDAIPLTELRFTLKNMTENVEIEVNVLTENDTLIESHAPGTVYKYMRLISTNVQNNNLDKASLKFRVNMTWISGNNIDKDTILLYQYDTSWSKLDTPFYKEEGEYAYYLVSELQGLSIFAISGEELPIELVCGPGSSKCVANDLYECSPDGMSWGLKESCAYGCNASTSECMPEPSCPEPECPEPKEAKICSPGELKCSGDALRQCDAGGTGWEIIKTCDGGCVCAGEPEAEREPVYLAVIAVLIIIVIALGAYLGLHK